MPVLKVSAKTGEGMAEYLGFLAAQSSEGGLSRMHKSHKSNDALVENSSLA
jgi:hypothetical protein